LVFFSRNYQRGFWWVTPVKTANLLKILGNIKTPKMVKVRFSFWQHGFESRRGHHFFPVSPHPARRATFPRERGRGSDMDIAAHRPTSPYDG
jgi:hypothetical protein